MQVNGCQELGDAPYFQERTDEVQHVDSLGGKWVFVIAIHHVLERREVRQSPRSRYRDEAHSGQRGPGPS